jgi:hypothetical protein
MDEPVGVVRVPFSPDDIAAHDEHDHLAAIFADREQATAAVEELRALGLGSEHLGVAVHGGDTVVFEHDQCTRISRTRRCGRARCWWSCAVTVTATRCVA